MTLFDKNLAKWSKNDPKTATLLPFLEREEVVFPSDVDLMYIFGLPDEAFFEEAKLWLKKKRKRGLVFLEDDLHRLKEFLATPLASKVLAHPKSHVVSFRDLEEEVPFALDELMWYFVQGKSDILADPYYAKRRKEDFVAVRDQLFFKTERLKLVLEEYFVLGAPFFYNFYKNVVKLKDSHLGNKLFKKFKQVPAIIVGAGPSLEKQIPLLKTLKGKALIFAGGSSMNALNSFGVMPHFGGGIDPNAFQKERLKTHQGSHLPYFYRNRMNHEAFDLLKGVKLYVSGSGGYDLAIYFDEALSLKESDLDEGHNVVNFLTEIAERMGCSPIIYIGLDLALTGGKAYSKGIDTGASSEKRILKLDVFGQPIETLWKWVAESTWMSSFAKEHPKTLFYNATEGGIGIQGIESLPFLTAVSQFKEIPDLQKRIDDEVALAKFPKNTEKKIEEALQNLDLSFDRSEELLNGLIQEIETLLSDLAKGKHIPEQSGRSVFLESELSEEIAYKYVLNTFNMVATKFFSFEWRHTSSKKKRLQLAKKKLNILLAVVRLNKAIINKGPCLQ